VHHGKESKQKVMSKDDKNKTKKKDSKKKVKIDGKTASACY